MEQYNGTVYDALYWSAQKYPHGEAIYFLGTKCSYSQLLNRIDKCANALSAIGIKRGDHVAIALPNYPQALIAFYAINKIGAVACMIRPDWSDAQIQTYMNDLNCKAAFTWEGNINAISNVNEIRKIILCKAEDELDLIAKLALYRVSAKKSIRHQKQNATENGKIIGWKKFIALKQNAPVETSKKSSDTCVILSSGGTTGYGKAIRLTNENVNECARMTGLSVQDLEGGKDKMLAFLPLFHGFGLGIGVHMTFCFGVCCVLVPNPSAKNIVETILQTSCNWWLSVPSMYEAIINNPAMAEKDLSFVRGLFCGGDILTGKLKSQINKFLQDHNSKGTIREGYGMAEAVAAVTLESKNSSKSGSVGTPVGEAGATMVAILDEKKHQILQDPFQTGEVLISSRAVMAGYMPGMGDEENPFYLAGGRKWLRTGDLGYLDNDGSLYLSGRKKRMLIVSGFNVYPSTIENAISQLDFVKEVCVVGKENNTGSESITAFVAVKKNNTCDEEEYKKLIYKHCKNNLSAYEIPSAVRIVEELPKTSIGKIDYKQLTKQG